MSLQEKLIKTLNKEVEELNEYERTFKYLSDARKIDNSMCIRESCMFYQAKIEEKSTAIYRFAILVGLSVTQNKDNEWVVKDAEEWEMNGTQELEEK